MWRALHNTDTVSSLCKVTRAMMHLSGHHCLPAAWSTEHGAGNAAGGLLRRC